MPFELKREPVRMRQTLPARDYYAPEVFDLEKERIFYQKWFCAGRQEELPNERDHMIREVLNESILIVRGESGMLRAFYNVCRHRGSKLCDGAGRLGSAIVCPYHGWTYSLNGRLVGTPNVGEVEGFDRSEYGLHAVALETWNGFVFVNLSANPRPLEEQLGPWRDYQRYHIERLRSGWRVVYEVAANWKILHENYNECLHCPRVHPELVKLIPIYRRGLIAENDGSWGNRLADGVTTFSKTGHSKLPFLPDLTEEEKRSYNGMTVFPNLMLDLLPDHVMTSVLWPTGPERTRVVSEILFEPATLARDDFDPADIVELQDLVSRQDWVVCERAQQGLRSRAFKFGVYPPQDEFVYEFDQEYLRARGPAPADDTGAS